MADYPTTRVGRGRMLPRIGSPAYHLLLAAVAILILGPLGGISAAFMNFSIGFFIGGQVLAGILGSTVTLPYGPEGRHGANYMQTMAASVAGMSGMAVLAQAMVWLGLPEPPAWKLALYFMSIGMFGVGVGMLYTPVLVDRMQLAYPSGFAVANILRALTDPNLLKRSVAKLGGGMLTGYAGGLFALKLPALAGLGMSPSSIAALTRLSLSPSTFGAGLIVGARIAVPALVVALIGKWQTPRLVSLGWLEPGEPFRKIGFIIALGTILGAAVLDVALILIQAARRFRLKSGPVEGPAADWKRVNLFRLVLWVGFWGAATVFFGSQVLRQPVFFLAVAVGLSFLFVLVNGISLGISDWNPISSAFVLTVFILAALGLRDPGVGLLCAAILLIACTEGGDMQQDRSTGWRLGTNRVTQFRYQVIGIVMGAALAVVLAKVFMHSYPVLRVDQFTHPHTGGAQQWQSAMTYKLVGALNGITTSQPQVMRALRLGVLLGLAIEIARKLIKRVPAYQRALKTSARARAGNFLLDAVLLPSPYASAFGGFVELPTVLWWTAGGVGSSVFDYAQARRALRRPPAAAGSLPPDMSTMSLIGGGLIAGDSLAALSVGLYGLIRTVL
ncbi:MAG TPA: OPT/YSL family transporter [Candidatus Paceibacterota bacterium]|nr:OPT/YSL family transporter [Verrucomicrobiota bacterium]HRY58042.1 OPT/YSL family transporter [Candidatus Paceibacterota bacterium]HOW79986.1 OPT/YSL family transporter [Verrucomicrobiota bacterium]HQE90867.1 OPT/YSL family transporter [Verrucomicrobiota bacterium]HQH03452.1 OPT/YSL family transporter [Verrucomicrobiota bacterium]